MGNRSSSSAADATDDRSGCTSTIAAEASTGWHVLKVKGYTQSRGVLGPGKCIESSSFTVGGHTWCTKYYPDGFDRDSQEWISVYLALCRPGSRDDAVKTLFKISLLDQDGKPVVAHMFQSMEARTFSVLGGSPLMGFRHFIKRYGVLERSSYLKDDSFSIGCEVTVINGVSRVAAKNQFVTVPPSDLNKELRVLLLEGQGADVTFEVEGEHFSAHRSILAARSSVFKAELFGPMQEKTGACVQVGDMEPKVFRAMLLFIYTDSLPAMGAAEKMAMAQHLLVAADRYDLKRLKLVCEDMLCNHINRRTAAAMLVLADLHGCHGLKEACFAFLSSREHVKATMATKDYEHLRSSCPLLHDELVASLAPDVFEGNKIKRSLSCFS
ncbi:unnamed protein product [Urochloa decumbens]|uniref:Uncharacterized protein n=1 Tax=Urochloa decumbens TaxID=240449 RepID=A0ABC9AIQ4_9POAL